MYRMSGIQGGYIHGKYILWPGILYAWIAQCVGILLFCGFVVGARCARRKPFLMKAILSPALLLLTLFPIWMDFYVDGVLGNSDGVCFTKHLSVGWGDLCWNSLLGLADHGNGRGTIGCAVTGRSIGLIPGRASATCDRAFHPARRAPRPPQGCRG